MTQMIPSNAPTMLPGGIPVQSSSGPSGGSSVVPTAKGSGTYAQAGSTAALNPIVGGPVRDYVVRLHNDSTKPFRMRYLTLEYLIQPDDELVVPWEVMVSFLGSPDAQNLGPRRMDRKNVYEKLRVKYGAYHDDAVWEINKPQLSAYRVTGERLTTVVDDPDGLSITPSSITQQTELAREAQLAMMQDQMVSMAALIKQLTGQSTNPPGTVQSDANGPSPVPQDAPVAPEWTAEMAARAGEPGVVPPMHPGPIPPVQVATEPPNPVPHMTPQMPPQSTTGAGGQAGVTLAPPAPGLGSATGGATVDTPTNPLRVT